MRVGRVIYVLFLLLPPSFSQAFLFSTGILLEVGLLLFCHPMVSGKQGFGISNLQTVKSQFGLGLVDLMGQRGQKPPTTLSFYLQRP